MNLEIRDNTRFDHEAPISIQSDSAGVLHGSKMYNYSNNGIYFESDFRLKPGIEIFVGIKDSPFASEYDIFECYRSVIRWRKGLKRSPFSYGYGVELFERAPRGPQSPSKKDSRKYHRNNCAVPLKYALKGQVYKGLIKNISSVGAFIESGFPLSTGRYITMAIPVVKKHKIIKRKGKIVWVCDTGYGVKFIKT